MQVLPAQIVYGVLNVGIWGTRALRAHIKAIDGVRVQVGEIEVKMQGVRRCRQQRLGLVSLEMVV